MNKLNVSHSSHEKNESVAALNLTYVRRFQKETGSAKNYFSYYALERAEKYTYKHWKQVEPIFVAK
jgi:hypothetical protein